MKRISIISISIFLITILSTQTQKAFAQNEILYFSKSSPQVSQQNPAMTTTNNFYATIVFGMTGFGFNTSGFSYHDLIHQHPTYQDSLQLDIQNFRNTLDDDNFLSFNYDMDLFGLGFKAGKNYINYDLSLHSDTRLNFSKGIFDFVLDGCDASEENIKLLDGHLLEHNSYISNAIGYARDINNRLTIGGKIKLITGLINVSTEQADLEVDFAGDEKVSISGDLDIHTSNVLGQLQINSIFQENATQEFLMAQNINDILQNGIQNTGLSFDIGATYRLFDCLELSLSAIDVYSAVNWKTNTTQIVNHKPNEEIAFTGITSSIDSLEINLTDQLTALGDSVVAAMDIRTDSMDSYTSPLPTKINFGASFNFGKVNYLHGLFSTKINKGNIYDTRFSLFYSLETKAFSLSFGNVFMTSNIFNPSAAISFRSGFSQVFIAGNLHTKKQFNVADFSGLEVLVGMNFTIGKRPYWQRGKKE